MCPVIPVARDTLAAAVLILIGVRCHLHRDWEGADAFTQELRCHMDVDTVRRLALKYGATNFLSAELAGSPGIPDYYATKNERVISFWFDRDGLIAYM